MACSHQAIGHYLNQYWPSSHHENFWAFAGLCLNLAWFSTWLYKGGPTCVLLAAVRRPVIFRVTDQDPWHHMLSKGINELKSLTTVSSTPLPQTRHFLSSQNMYILSNTLTILSSLPDVLVLSQPNQVSSHVYLIEAEWRMYASVQHSNIASDNGLSLVLRQAIIWINAAILSIRP